MRLNVLALSFLFPNAAQRGYGVFVLNRLKAVQQYCNIKVIAPLQWYPFMARFKKDFSGSTIPDREEIEGVDVFHPRFAVVPRYLKWFDSLSYLWAASLVALRLRKEAFNFDLVDVHWTYPDIVAGYVLARCSGKKYIVTVRGHEAFYDEERSIRRWLVACLLKQADFVVALSAELRDKVLALGAAPDRVRVVLNGVDSQRFGYRDRDECRRQLGLSAEGRMILSVGRLTERKGHHELIRMIPLLVESGPVHLYIVGGVNREDDFSHKLKAMIAELCPANVTLVERVVHDELASWYGAADLFCLATMSEGCPNVVLEALACGTPVVATNAGAISELIVQGENGVVVNSADMSSFGEIVNASLAREWDRRKIAEKMGAWGWNACATQVVDIYRTVLLKRGERSAV